MTESDRREAIALYDRFTHEGMDRRAFMAELTRIAGGAAAASMLLGSVAAQAGAAPLIPADDRRLAVRTQRLGTGAGQMVVYRAIRRDLRPRLGRARPPAVLVVHENRGLNEHIRDVARRLALAGYDAVAPDFLSLDGGATPVAEDQARAAIGALDLARATAAGAGLIRLLHTPRRRENRPRPTPVGVVGFCWGGAMVHRLALAAGDELKAGVSFYGPAPQPAEAARLKAPLLVILAARDERVNRTALPYVAAAQAAGKAVRAINYPEVNHAFHNDTSGARYDRAAAAQAWGETLAFFRQHLR